VKDKYGNVEDDEFTSSDSEEEDDDAEVNLYWTSRPAKLSLPFLKQYF